MNKYRAKKTHGYDSKAEYYRAKELEILEKAGVIKNLSKQVKFELIPSQKKDGKVIERAVSYYADFVYSKDGSLVVEDVKGVETKEYVIKRKLMLWLHGIKIYQYKK